MRCDHPECTGRHRGPADRLCPAATKRRREYQRKYRANMTPEQRERKLEYDRKYYANMTPEQRERRRESYRNYYTNNYTNITPEEKARFWEQVIGREDPFGCWEWTGRIDSKGYGIFGWKKAHRVAWELANGPLPKGMALDHLCRWRRCVNPLHLEVVTRAENTRRKSVPPAQPPDVRPTYIVVDGELYGFWWPGIQSYVAECNGVQKSECKIPGQRP